MRQVRERKLVNEYLIYRTFFTPLANKKPHTNSHQNKGKEEKYSTVIAITRTYFYLLKL